jgi:hypothetical protein
MASSSQKCHAYIYDRKFSRNAYNDRDYDHDILLPALLMIVVEISLGAIMLCLMRLGGVMLCLMFLENCAKNSTIYHACNTSFVLSCKNAKVVARKLGSKCKGDKTCIWVPKVIVTNLVGPNKSWVPKTQA